MQQVQTNPRPKLLPLAAFGTILMIAGCAGVGQPAVVGNVQSMSSLSSLRVANGLGPLSPDPKLEKAAAQQAGFMAESGRMSHSTGYGRDFTSRMSANGVTGPRAENVATVGDAGKAFTMWSNSPPHRRNMLDPRFSHYGLASASDGKGRRYWALVLSQ